MISKETFVKTLTALEEKRKKIDNISDLLEELTGEYSNFWALTFSFETMIVDLINEAMNLEKSEMFGTDLDYYLYELDSGTKSELLEEGDALYGVHSYEELYDYLIENSVKKEDK